MLDDRDVGSWLIASKVRPPTYGIRTAAYSGVWATKLPETLRGDSSVVHTSPERATNTQLDPHRLRFRALTGIDARLLNEGAVC
jgi:hypothetical protein